MKHPIRLLAWLLLLCLAAPAAAAGPLVLAAASLQEALEAVGAAWARGGHAPPVFSFAASSALARQIVAGAPADLFLSADRDWMDAVARAGRLRPGTRADLLGNRLVLVAPRASRVRLAAVPGMPLVRALGGGRLALADPAAVPAGRYARAALVRLGAWQGVAGRLAPGESVRAALALVERGAAPLGIVYATDALASRQVRVVATFPAASHPPIVYPVAVLRPTRDPDALAFRRFLDSPAATAVFRRHGFLTR